MAEARYQLVYKPEFVEDLQRLAAAAQQDRRSQEARLLQVTLEKLKRLTSGQERGTHGLGYMKGYPDLSDCETTYIGTHPERRSEARLVWRELPPERPGALPRREVLALGTRDGGAVYDEVGRRLERPVGTRLEDLPNTAERAAADRDTLRRVRAAAREQQSAAIREEQDRPIGRGEPPELDR